MTTIDKAGAPAEPAEPVLLRTATPWGVRLTLNRPAKLNALSDELVRGLVEAMDDATADPDVRNTDPVRCGRAASGAEG